MNSYSKQEEKRSEDHVHGKLNSSDLCETHAVGGASKKLENEPKAADSPFGLTPLFKFLALTDVRLLALRSTVLLCLLATAVVVGYFSYTLLRANETTLKNHHYQSLVDQLETYVDEIMNRQYQALSLVAAAPRNRCPTASSWPNCAVNFAYMSSTANSLISMTQSRGVGFSPFVRESEVSSFETFVYQFYAQQGYSTLGQQYGFKGINAKNSSGKMYHMTTPDPSGQNSILVPIVQIAKMEDNLRAYMFNLYSEPIRIANIDYMISCTKQRNTDCLAISDVVHLVQDTSYRPAVLLHYPVRLTDTNKTIVGLISGVINWDTILSFSVPGHVEGILAVLRSERNNVEQFYTFQFEGGDASFVGLGDLHDKRYDFSRRTIVVSPYSGSTNYTLFVYSSDSFEEEYYTMGPTIACVISVLVVVVTSFIFIAYDALMNRRARESELVIQTRQQFVRFISHEIRTPINTIGLGMKFFAKQIEDLLIDPSLDVLTRLRSMLELVHDVEQSSEAAIVILNDLINYDKLKGGMLQLEVEEIDIIDHMMSTIRPFKVQAQQVNVEILVELRLQDDNETKRMHDLLVLGDRVKIGQVMRNLISNALKFTPKEGQVTVTAKWLRQGLPNAATLTVTSKSDEAVIAPTNKLESTRSQATMQAETPADASADNIPHESQRHLARCGSLLIMVKDSGVGLSAEQCSHLFREGVQFNANKLQGGGGSGLGLFIAKGMAELHGGTLQGSSEGIGKGCTFTLELPVYEVSVHPFQGQERDAYQRNTVDVEQGVTGHAMVLSSLNSFAYGPIGSEEGGDEPEPKSTVSDTSSVVSINITGGLNAVDQLLASPTALESLGACSPPRDSAHTIAQRRKERQDRQERILVVDDSVLACKMVTRLLTCEGYLVESCLDGHSCLTKVLEHFQPDESRPFYTAILLDSDMPGISGVEVAERLRAAGYTWPIVGVTGHVHQEDIDNFVHHGASIVLSKPLDYARLEKVLQEMA